MMNNMKFNELPMNIQYKVKDLLKAFRSVYVTFEDGQYHVSTGICIKASYSSDDKFISEYTDEEVFTADERILNYVEEFHEYPTQYKGMRDYKFLKSLVCNEQLKFDVNGNIVKA